MLIWDLKAGRNKSRQKKEEKGEEQVKKREEEKNNIINIPGHGICDFVSIGEAQQ